MARTSRYFQSGESVALRYITRDGRPGDSWPYTVVRDDAELLALYIPRGAVHTRWSGAGVERRPQDTPWRRDTLRLMTPGASHSTWLFWEYGEDDARRFMAYYVNFEEPFRRTPIGFDTNDHMLDIVVAPDFSWRWKDEEDFDRRVASGVYGADFGASVRADALGVVARIEGREAPFDGGWRDWLPDRAWAVPSLPDEWQTLPAALWERRRWAYGEIAPP